MSSQFVVALLGGLTLGSTYALITLGLVLIYRATGTLNFAHGELMLLAAFLVGKWTAEGSLSFFPALVAALVVTAALGALIYPLVLRRTAGMPHFMPVIATMGFAAMADGAFGIIFGANQYAIDVPGLPTGTVTIAGAMVATSSLALGAIAIALSIAVAIVLRVTSIGRRLRAAGQHALLASQGGINVHRIFIGSWAVAAALAGVAGVSYGATNVVTPSITGLALLAFPAMLLGGMDSVEGAIVGGLVMGVVQSFTGSYLGGEVVNVVTYSLLLVVLLVRPEGLFGTKTVRRV